MSLSKTEERLMTLIWKLENAFMKDLIELHEDPKPAATTLATLLKRMTEKGFINYETIGRSRKYYALVTKEDYVSGRFRGFIKNFFGNSSSQFASFFTNTNNMTDKELQELKAMIDDQIKNRKA